ncbi:GlcNAc-PI de-N-acetylase [Saccharopolyspora cebuensis]|uniref:GlcNAc-PI de-N-acetylase n=1 Tax=Saccharopolyspora cebuensis TaxID=418759 RepID=A0ABV4CNW6_9PSEU
MAVSFFVAAHPDDALLFRGDFAFTDMRWSGAKIVVIDTTAGDDGIGDAWWRARERGLVDACAAARPSLRISEDAPVFAGRAVQRYRGENWTCYFLRLPDGNLGGQGFPSHGNQSLQKLRAGQLPGGMTTVDGAATYPDWSAVLESLRLIVDQERQGEAGTPWVNASDWNAAENPDDHSDHYATGYAIRDALGPNEFNFAWWKSYCTRDDNRFPPNLSGVVLSSKRFLFYTYAWRVLPARPGYQGVIDGEWAQWGAKSYARTVTAV